MEEERRNIEGNNYNNSKKGAGKVLVSIMIFMLLVFGLGLFLGKELFDTKAEEPKAELKKDTLSEIGMESVMERFKAIPISSDRLYEKDKFDIASMNTNELLITALSKLPVYRTCSQEGLKKFTLEDINKEIKKYVLKTLTFNDIKNVDSASLNNPYDYAYGITVKNENEIEVSDYFCGSEFSANDYVNSKIIKGEREGDYIYIYEKKAFAKYIPESFNKTVPDVNYYKDYKKTGPVIETKPSSEFTNATGEIPSDRMPNWDLYNTYKYTFKLIDGAYYFQSLELVK